MNIHEYIKEYKDITFYEKKLTEVDILLFSQLSYVLLDNIDFTNDKSYTIEKLYPLIDQNKKKKYIISQRNASKLFDMINNTKRYKNVKIFNYQYNTNWDMQFCAMEFELPTKEIIIAFEGTDHTIAGWKEDAILSYKYPTESQKIAGIYMNNAIKKAKRKVYGCGHSKGGNLALTGSMRTSIFRKHKIISIYSFDGPGLKESEFNSLAYKSIRKRLHNIIPDTSLVGVLFKQENLDVIKSSQKGLLQHNAMTWLIDNDKFIRTKQNHLSIELDHVINNWLESYNYEERELIVDNFFRLLEEANITSLTEIKLRSLFEMVRVSKSFDKKTKQVLFNGIRVLLGGIGSTFINDEIAKLKSKFIKKK